MYILHYSVVILFFSYAHGRLKGNTCG